MSKRTLLMVVSIVASLAMVATGTLAYLSDSDMDTNVMVLGNVDIVQNEQERTEDGELDQFTQNKPAYPAVGPIEWADEGVEIGGTEYLVFTDELENVIDKFVTVTNTGKSDAYVRTIILIEAPEYDPNDLIHVNVNADIDYTTWAPVEIDGVEYVYSVFSYPEALAAGETSVPSLMQLFLDSKTTNEDVAKFGDTWEVHAISQAVQTNGFDDPATALDTAFGEVNAENLQDWVANTEVGSPGEEWPNNNPPSADAALVTTLEELEEALTTGKDIILMNDITMDNMIKIPDGAEVNLDLNGKTIDFERNSAFKPGNPLFYPLPGSKLTITGDGTVDLGDNFDTALLYPAGEVVIENGTFIRDRVPEGTSTDEVQTLFMGVKSVGASIVIEDGYFDSGYYDTNAEKAFSETEADIANRGKAADKNAYRTAIKDNVSLLVNLSWSSAAGTQDFRIYGGTFVGANPAWGDEGCAMPITPDYKRPWSYYQGTFLEGQTMYDDKIELPAGYSIAEGTTSDDRPTFTISYSK